jgi:hypothetical protein
MIAGGMGLTTVALAEAPKAKVMFSVKPDEHKPQFAWLVPVLQSRIGAMQESGDPLTRNQILECVVTNETFKVRSDDGQIGSVSETVVTCGERKFRVLGIEYQESR